MELFYYWKYNSYIQFESHIFVDFKQSEKVKVLVLVPDLIRGVDFLFF
jgi:hypothetical protein